MDARLAKILIERGRLKPKIIQQVQARRDIRPRDLLKQPRSPAEKAARLEVAALISSEAKGIKEVKAVKYTLEHLERVMREADRKAYLEKQRELRLYLKNFGLRGILE